jgi:hypothetical protein
MSHAEVKRKQFGEELWKKLASAEIPRLNPRGKILLSTFTVTFTSFQHFKCGLTSTLDD